MSSYTKGRFSSSSSITCNHHSYPASSPSSSIARNHYHGYPDGRTKRCRKFISCCPVVMPKCFLGVHEKLQRLHLLLSVVLLKVPCGLHEKLQRVHLLLPVVQLQLPGSLDLLIASPLLYSAEFYQKRPDLHQKIFIKRSGKIPDLLMATGGFSSKGFSSKVGGHVLELCDMAEIS
eukprot:g52173.t1